MPSNSRHLRTLLISVVAGMTVGLGIDCLYLAAIFALRRIPAEAGDLLVPVWMGLFYALAPGVAGVVAALIVRSIRGRQPCDPADTSGASLIRLDDPALAWFLAAALTFLAALALTFGPHLLGRMMQ